MRVQTRTLRAISEWKRPVEGKEFGSVVCCDRSCVSESVELERGFYGHFPVADFDAHRLGRVDAARLFQTGANVLFTPPELLGGLRCPTVIVNQKWSGQWKIAGSTARWTAVELDGRMTFISAHLPHKGKKLGEFEAVLMEIQEFVSGRPKQHVILGGDFNKPVRYDRLFPFWRVDSETEKAGGHERLTARESFACTRWWQNWT